jgi:hypothetical protein
LRRLKELSDFEVWQYRFVEKPDIMVSCEERCLMEKSVYTRDLAARPVAMQ